MDFLKSRLRAGLAELRDRSESFPDRPMVGCELEGFFIDPQTGALKHIAPQVLADLEPGIMALELGQAQFEINLQAAVPQRQLFESWRGELEWKLRLIAEVAEKYDASLLLKGVPSKLSPADLGAEKLYPVPRMGLLDLAWGRAWQSFRNDSRNIFRGKFEPSSVAVSSSMSSTQLHLQLPPCPQEAAKLFRAVSFVSPLCLGFFANSESFLGMNGYAEYRIPIWEVLDDAGRGRVFYGPEPKASLFEVFEHYVERVEFLHLGEDIDRLSDLELLRRHVKNMWPWLRLIPEADHWRVETRLFPSLPPEELLLLTYLWVGLCFGVEDVSCGVNSEHLAAIAKCGRRAEIVWLDGQVRMLGSVGSELLSLCEAGHAKLGSSDSVLHAALLQRLIVH